MVLDSHVQTPLGLQAQEALVTPLVTEFGRQNQATKCRKMAPTRQEIHDASGGIPTQQLNTSKTTQTFIKNKP